MNSFHKCNFPLITSIHHKYYVHVHSINEIYSASLYSIIIFCPTGPNCICSTYHNIQPQYYWRISYNPPFTAMCIFFIIHHPSLYIASNHRPYKPSQLFSVLPNPSRRSVSTSNYQGQQDHNPSSPTYTPLPTFVNQPHIDCWSYTRLLVLDSCLSARLHAHALHSL
jgi:hypothetical protein